MHSENSVVYAPTKTYSPMDRFKNINSATPGSGDGMRDVDHPRGATLQCPPGADQTITSRELRVAVVSCDAKKFSKSEIFELDFISVLGKHRAFSGIFQLTCSVELEVVARPMKGTV